MSIALKERVYAVYEAFSLGNFDILSDMFDEQVEFESNAPIEVFPYLGRLLGRAAVIKATVSKSPTPTSSNAAIPHLLQRRSGSSLSSVAAAAKASCSYPLLTAFCKRLMASHGEMSRGAAGGIEARLARAAVRRSRAWDMIDEAFIGPPP